MAVNYVLNNSINICKLFPLLPINPTGGVGCIRQAKYGNVMPWSGGENNDPFMKNTIMINIMTPDRELNIKLFKDKMHSCGFKDQAVGLKGAQLLVGIINDIVENLDYIQQNLDQYWEVVDWLRPRCKLSDASTSILTEPRDSAPDNISSKMLNFIVSHISYYRNYNDSYKLYLSHLQWLSNCKVINEGPKTLEVIKSVITMMNFNHELNFTLQKIKLAMIFKENPEFRVRFDNMIDHSVTISLPYESDADKKSKEHTFSVHHEGHINQSSPNRELAKIAYEKFISYIMQHKSEIIISEKEIDIFYKPSR